MAEMEESGRLEMIVQQMGEAVLAATETIDRMAERIDTLAAQVQQQGYQIFALSDAVQTLAETQESSLEQVNRLTTALHRFVDTMENTPASK